MEPMEPTDDNRLDHLLRAELFRRDCPDPMQLGGYQLGLLADLPREQIAAHVARCPHCQAELRDLAAFRPEPRPVADKARVDEARGFRLEWGAAGQLVVRLLDILAPPPAPRLALGGVKGRAGAGTATGGETGAEVVRRLALGPEELDDLDLEVVVRRQARDAEHYDVHVRAEVPSRWPERASLHVRASAGEWQAAGITNERGQVLFEGLPAAALPKLTIAVDSEPDIVGRGAETETPDTPDT